MVSLISTKLLLQPYKLVPFKLVEVSTVIIEFGTKLLTVYLRILLKLTLKST